MSHWLSRLLSPKSIAIVGASERPGSLGAFTLQQLVERNFGGDIYPVNPRYDEIFKHPCYTSITDLPISPDLVVYAISGFKLEESFYQALEKGVGGIVIYASNNIKNDKSPKLTDRLRSAASNAGVPVIGGNSMGFYNYDSSVFVSFDSPPKARPPGHIGLILHSGSGMTYLANNDARFCFNYVIASAQEINASVGNYIDYLLDQSSTRVIAIFLETVRDVPVFMAALEKARRLHIPVVITKLGRTEKSAKMALSHSGAMIGDHDVFVASCEQNGVVFCDDADEMIATAMLLSINFDPKGKSIASLLDSGGLREQMMDLADDLNIEFANVSLNTLNRIDEYLEEGLEAANPLDAMGAIAGDINQTYFECGKALLDDIDSSLLTMEFEFRDGFSQYDSLMDVARRLACYNEKPFILINSSSFSRLENTAAELLLEGIPVINGIQLALKSISNLLEYHDSLRIYKLQEFITPQAEMIDTDLIFATTEKWKSALEQREVLDESQSLQLMTECDLPVSKFAVIDNFQALNQKALEFGFPVVLKTAMPGIAHKSDRDGVKVNIQSLKELESAYRDLVSCLGHRVLLMPMADSGVEVSIGMKNDPDYGAMIILACGGILIELMNERSFRMTPVNEYEADEMIRKLKLSALIDGVRGQPALDRSALVKLISSFSIVAGSLTPRVSEIDLNPVIVHQTGCTIVDALVVTN